MMSGRACLVLICRTAGAHGWITDNEMSRKVEPLCFAGDVYIGALLGPERTRECFFLGETYTGSGLWSYRAFSGVAGAAVGLGCVCCLRIAQWTRASLFVVSVLERTVDALAPGADEGRRRLR